MCDHGALLRAADRDELELAGRRGERIEEVVDPGQGTPQGFLDAWGPVFFFAMIFAISMDYTVFLLVTAREHWDRTHDAKEAAIGGLAHSLAAGAYIGRWWAVLAGFAPLAALGVLELSGHVAPWHDAGPPLTQLVDYGLWYFVSTVVAFWLLPIAAGVALRKGLGQRPEARLTHY